MKILIANPNTTIEITDRLVAVARSFAASSTEITGLTAPRGVPYIATRAEAAIAGGITLEMLAEHISGYDAAIVAAFGDPGLGGAREMFAVPVVGMAETSMLTACMLGRSFAILTFSAALEPWYRECVEANGLQNRLAGIRCLEGTFASIINVQHEKEDALVHLANDIVRELFADVIVLAGAPLAGLADRVKDRIPVPVVDGIGAAIKQAEALASLRLTKATAGSFRRPASKQSTGLSGALTRLLKAE